MSTGASSHYIHKKDVNESYRPKGYGISAGLQRARAGYRFRNAITGVIIASFAVGVWAYSMNAVKQDDFGDVDEEAKALVAARNVATGTGGEESRTSAAVAVTPQSSSATQKTTGALSSTPSELLSRSNTDGILAPRVHERFPTLLDPTRRTFIWGAPPVDRPGRLSDRS